MTFNKFKSIWGSLMALYEPIISNVDMAKAALKAKILTKL